MRTLRQKDDWTISPILHKIFLLLLWQKYSQNRKLFMAKIRFWRVRTKYLNSCIFCFFFFFIVSIFCFFCVLLEINILISFDFLCFLVSVPLEGEVEEEAPMSVRTVDSERSESSKGSNYSHGNYSFFCISFTIFFLFFCVDGNLIIIYSDLFNYQDF